MDLDNDGFSEFLEVFVDALHGYGTYWNGSSYQDDSELEEWPPCYDGDVDNLFYVSLGETFQYAWKYDDYRILGDESPWYDDDGDKLPTYKDDQDHYDESQGGLANQTDIFRPSGDLIGEYLTTAPDGDVDIYDLVVVTKAYGSSPGEPNWNPKADVNNDRVVDIFDLVLTALYYEFRTPINKRIGSSSREQLRA